MCCGMRRGAAAHLPPARQARRIVVFGKGKVMPGIEPTVVGAAKAVEGATFDHGDLLKNGIPMAAV